MFKEGDICIFTDEEGSQIKGNYNYSYQVLRHSVSDVIYVYTKNGKYFTSSTCVPFVSCRYNNVFKGSKQTIDMRV